MLAIRYTRCVRDRATGEYTWPSSDSGLKFTKPAAATHLTAPYGDMATATATGCDRGLERSSSLRYAFIRRRMR